MFWLKNRRIKVNCVYLYVGMVWLSFGYYYTNFGTSAKPKIGLKLGFQQTRWGFIHFYFKDIILRPFFGQASLYERRPRKRSNVGFVHWIQSFTLTIHCGYCKRKHIWNELQLNGHLFFVIVFVLKNNNIKENYCKTK